MDIGGDRRIRISLHCPTISKKMAITQPAAARYIITPTVLILLTNGMNILTSFRIKI